MDVDDLKVRGPEAPAPFWTLLFFVPEESAGEDVVREAFSMPEAA